VADQAFQVGRKIGTWLIQCFGFALGRDHPPQADASYSETASAASITYLA
jgi:hypothetical protein